jgi:hypothetical protein
MNLKELETRKADLLNEMETLSATKLELMEAFKQNTANMQAIHGAVQDCEYWIKKIKEEGTTSSNKDKLKELVKT